MKMQEQVQTTTPRRTDVQPHRLGMGWHFVWHYDPPIVHHVQREDGTSYYWDEEGETSEGCIMWLADQFAIERLDGMTACEVYRAAYKERDGGAHDDEWLHTDALRSAWGDSTISPKRWTETPVRKLLEDLEDVNYHSFLARLIELIGERTPKLAEALSDWCQEVTP
jgi:hypothetical protein